MRTQWSCRPLKIGDLGLASARAFCVPCHLERIELRRVVADLPLYVDATSRLEPSAHDPGHILKPLSYVRLEGRGLKVSERAVNPVVDRRGSEHRVEVRIAFRQVVRLKVRELLLDGSRYLRVERFDDLPRFLIIDLEKRSDLRR